MSVTKVSVKPELCDTYQLDIRYPSARAFGHVFFFKFNTIIQRLQKYIIQQLLFIEQSHNQSAADFAKEVNSEGSCKINLEE